MCCIWRHILLALGCRCMQGHYSCSLLFKFYILYFTFRCFTLFLLFCNYPSSSLLDWLSRPWMGKRQLHMHIHIWYSAAASQFPDWSNASAWMDLRQVRPCVVNLIYIYMCVCVCVCAYTCTICAYLWMNEWMTLFSHCLLATRGFAIRMAHALLCNLRCVSFLISYLSKPCI